MAKLNLSSPWMIYYREISALFKEDPEIRILLDEDAMELKIYIARDKKALAIEALLPSEQEFGNVTLNITILRPNKLDLSDSRIDVIKEAFKDNPAVCDIKTISGMFDFDLYFVIFKKIVVQYFTDDLSDYHGLKSTLYEDLARKVFGQSNNIFFCTDCGMEAQTDKWLF